MRFENYMQSMQINKYSLCMYILSARVQTFLCYSNVLLNIFALIPQKSLESVFCSIYFLS